MKGTYVIVMELPRDTRVKGGSLGTFDFPQGCYAYAGSAQAGIERRVSRHVTKHKTMRWHIDYLVAKVDVVSRLLIPFGGKDMECAVAKALMNVDGASVIAKGFGSSDCRCPSHLVYLGTSEELPRVLEEVLFRLCRTGSVHPYSVGQ
ncbi:MAG: GIY-YIG nuclease family protein [Candidatus Thermoplasmatota archaeon]